MANHTASPTASIRTGHPDGSAPKKSNRGFASMDAARQREIASQGGRAAHVKGTAHEFTSEEARAAGSKSHKSGRALSRSAAAGGSTVRSDSSAGTNRGIGAGGSASAHGADSAPAAGSLMRDEAVVSHGAEARNIEAEGAQDSGGDSPAGM